MSRVLWNFGGGPVSIRLRSRLECCSRRDHQWTLGTSSGDQLTARNVIVATGVLTQPKPPDIAGVEFVGTTLHTARWDHDIDLRGNGSRSSAPAPPRSR